MNKCPYCDHEIRKSATICIWCSRDLKTGLSAIDPTLFQKNAYRYDREELEDNHPQPVTCRPAINQPVKPIDAQRKFKVATCKACGAPSKVYESTDVIVCEYCGREIVEEKKEKIVPQMAPQVTPTPVLVQVSIPEPKTKPINLLYEKRYSFYSISVYRNRISVVDSRGGIGAWISPRKFDISIKNIAGITLKGFSRKLGIVLSNGQLVELNVFGKDSEQVRNVINSLM